jgi:hypothetical protein
VLQVGKKSARFGARADRVTSTSIMPALLAPLLALALAAAPDPYEVGLERYRQADYLAAAQAFRESVARPANPQREARANLWLGVSLFNISETEAARLAFKSALLGDRTLTLPDEAPPTAQPLFDDVRRSLPPLTPAPSPPPKPAEVAPAPVPTPPHASHELIIDVPPAAPEVRQADEREVEAKPVLRPWMATVALGTAGGLAVAAGVLELGANTNYASARSARYATTASQLVQRGNGEQDAARAAGVAALAAGAAAVALYFLSH